MSHAGEACVGTHAPGEGDVAVLRPSFGRESRGGGLWLAGGAGDGVARGRKGQSRHLAARGYFGVVAWHNKTAVNLGTLWRSASVFGAAFIGTIGRRYQRQSSDTMLTPRHTPLFHWDDEADFWRHVPDGCQPVAVEIAEGARDLTTFRHPQSAVYVLGPEDGSLPTEIMGRCSCVARIPGNFCLNLAVAGSIVLYDRIAKAIR